MHTCEPRQFLQPCLLLLLREAPGHGYQLVERLKSFGVGDSDPGGVYRLLRGLERDGLARSAWRPSDAGPARRTYYLTTAGLRALEGLVRELQETRSTLDTYLERYGCADAAAAPATLSVVPS